MISSLRRTVGVAVVCAAATVSLPGGLMTASWAQTGSPFAPLPPAAPATPTPPADTATTSTSATSSDNLSAGMQILVFGGAAALLGSIAFVIVRDARARAPGADHSLTPRSGSAAKPDRARARKKAKAARAQRKRNR